MAAKEGVDVLYLTMEHWPAAQAVFGAMAAAVPGQLPRSAACALVAAAARGLAQAHVGNDQDKSGASLHVMQEALGVLNVTSITEALQKVRAVRLASGEPWARLDNSLLLGAFALQAYFPLAMWRCAGPGGSQAAG